MPRPADLPPRNAKRRPRAESGDLTKAGNSSSDTAAAPFLQRQRRQRHIQAVHRLGPRVLFELVDEVARHHPDLADDIDRRLSRYAALDPSVLAATGTDRFPPAALRVAPRS